MAQNSWFFNSAPGDPRMYQASDFARYFGKVLSTGLLHVDEVPGLLVKAEGTDLRTYAEPGGAIMEGYAYENTDNEYLTHSLPEVNLDRIDRIVLRLDKKNANRYIKLFVIEGEPSLTPVAPTLQRDNLVWELSLAQVRIRANTSTINSADVLDERLDRAVCGLVFSLISKPAPADIQTGGYAVTATEEGQKDFEIPLMSFDKVGDGLTVYVGGDKAAYDSYEVIYPRTVRFNVGKSLGTLVEFDIIRGRVLLEDDYVVTAGGVGIKDAGNYYVADNTEGALQQIGQALFTPKPKVFGIRIDLSNPHPYDSVEYIDDAKDITSPGDWSNKFPFNAIKPCMVRNGAFQFYLNPNDYSKKIDGSSSNHKTFDNGDVVVEIPTIYWKVEKDSSYLYIRISETKQDGFEAVAHTRGNVLHNKLYLSAYALCEGADSRLYSISGQTYKPDLTVENARLKIANKGSGYQQIGLAQVFLWQMLFLLKYKSLSSDDALGIAPSTFKDIAGFTDAMGMDTGSTDNSRPFKFIGIEQMVSRNHVLIDGYINGSIHKYSNIGANFGIAANYEHVLPDGITIASGFITSVAGTAKFPFFPTRATGSSSTFFSDYVNGDTFGFRYSGLNVFPTDNGIFATGNVGATGRSQTRFCFFG